MASIISPNDFIQQYNIPNRNEPNTNSTIQWYINKYEPILLNELLGDVLYSSLKTGLASNPIEQQWADLADKVTLSIICFVYWHYRMENTTQPGNIGETAPNTENSTIVSPMRKMVDRWNEMVRNNFDAAKFINSDVEAYGAYYRNFGWHDCLPNIFQTRNIWGL